MENDCMGIGKVESYIHAELGKKSGLLFSLIDPVDYPSVELAAKAGRYSAEAGADIVLVGGSIGAQGELLDAVCRQIRQEAGVPVVLFPGNIASITKYADAIYFMTLLNSRNPYWISQAQALSAQTLAHMKVEALPVGYVVVEPGGTVGWVADVNLVPRGRPQIAAALALAAQYSGSRFLLTDAGSNPKEGHIPLQMVKTVSEAISIPYIVAGGIRTAAQAGAVISAGADIVQVGTALERNANLSLIAKAVHTAKKG